MCFCLVILTEIYNSTYILSPSLSKSGANLIICLYSMEMDPILQNSRNIRNGVLRRFVLGLRIFLLNDLSTQDT
jgi:hypothetical protein